MSVGVVQLSPLHLVRGTLGDGDQITLNVSISAPTRPVQCFTLSLFQTDRVEVEVSVLDVRGGQVPCVVARVSSVQMPGQTPAPTIAPVSGP